MSKEKDCYYYHIDGEPRKIRTSKPKMIADSHLEILHYLAKLYQGQITKEVNGDIKILIQNIKPEEDHFSDLNY